MKMTRSILAALMIAFSSAGLMAQAGNDATEADLLAQERSMAQQEQDELDRKGDIIAQGGEAAYMLWLKDRETDYLLKRAEGRLASVGVKLAEVRQALDAQDSGKVQGMLDPDGQAAKEIKDAGKILSFVAARQDLTE